MTAEEKLRAAIHEATEDARMREKALTLAVGHFRKINWSGDPKKITGLAAAFHDFLRGAR